jgi:hypothetical protein
MKSAHNNAQGIYNILFITYSYVSLKNVPFSSKLFLSCKRTFYIISAFPSYLYKFLIWLNKDGFPETKNGLIYSVKAVNN